MISIIEHWLLENWGIICKRKEMKIIRAGLHHLFWSAAEIHNMAGYYPSGEWIFSDSYFFLKKWVWRSQISWLFLINYELSENQKIFFWFFTVFLGDLEGAPPPHSSNIQKPHPIRIKMANTLTFLSITSMKMITFNTPVIECS